jgi:hypothetical protein
LQYDEWCLVNKKKSITGGTRHRRSPPAILARATHPRTTHVRIQNTAAVHGSACYAGLLGLAPLRSLQPWLREFMSIAWIALRRRAGAASTAPCLPGAEQCLRTSWNCAADRSAALPARYGTLNPWHACGVTHLSFACLPGPPNRGVFCLLRLNSDLLVSEWWHGQADSGIHFVWVCIKPQLCLHQICYSVKVSLTEKEKGNSGANATNSVLMSRTKMEN